MTNVEALRLFHKIELRLLSIEQQLQLTEISEKEKCMPVSPEVAAFITKVDAATDKIAARIQALINKPSTSLSTEDSAALQAEVDKLNLIGQDPADPLPPAVV